MKASELMRMLEGVPGDADVVVPADDHSYRRVDATLAKAEAFGKRRELLEWHGPEHASDPASPVVDVVVIA